MPEKEFIELKDVIAIMDSGQVFDITFVSADVKRGTGGEMKTRTNMVKSGTVKTVSNDEIDAEYKMKKKVNPNHFQNSTRNIHPTTNPRELTKIHLRLITRFNGKRVL